MTSTFDKQERCQIWQHRWPFANLYNNFGNFSTEIYFRLPMFKNFTCNNNCLLGWTIVVTFVCWTPLNVIVKSDVLWLWRHNDACILHTFSIRYVLVIHVSKAWLMPEIDIDHFEIATYINTLSVVIYDKRSVYNRGIMTDTHYLIVKNP